MRNKSVFLLSREPHDLSRHNFKHLLLKVKTMHSIYTQISTEVYLVRCVFP